MDCLLVRSFFVEGFLTFSIILQLLFNSFTLKNLKYNFPVFNKELFIQTIFILLCLLFILLNINLETFFYNFLFINNSSIYLFKIIILIFCIFAIIIAYRSSLSQKINNLEFLTIVLLILFSSFLLISSYDLLSVYLALEMQSLCFYALASFKKDSAASVESGLKYFLLGSIASCFFLLGISLLYGCFGTLNLNDLIVLLSFNVDNDFYKLNVLVFGACLLIISVFFFKVGAFPFHWWQPDVYEGAPLASTIILVMLPKIVFFGFLVKYIFLFIEHFGILKDFFLISGILTIFFGAFFAMQQKRLKRFFIYSSIAQIGFLVILLLTDFVDGYSFLYFFLIIYLVSSTVIWIFYSVLFSARTKISAFENKFNSQIFLTSLANLFKKNKSWSFVFLVVFFSLAGIPPLGGFLAKMFVLFELLKNSYTFSTVIIVLISVLSVYYYIRVVKILFFETTKKSSNSLGLIEDNFIASLEYLLVSGGVVFMSILVLSPNLLLLFSQKLSLCLIC